MFVLPFTYVLIRDCHSAFPTFVSDSPPAAYPVTALAFGRDTLAIPAIALAIRAIADSCIVASHADTLSGGGR